MRRLSVVLGVLFIFLLSNCSGSKGVFSGTADKALVDSLIIKRQFRIVNHWALPTISSSMMEISSSGILGPGNSGQRIDLSGNGNFLEINGDSVKAFLPYFGERQMGGGYNSDGEGIKFDQLVEQINYNYNNRKNHHTVTFRANNGTESFDLTLYVYPNKKSSLLVNSSQRDAIRYEGTIRTLPKKENP